MKIVRRKQAVFILNTIGIEGKNNAGNEFQRERLEKILSTCDVHGRFPTIKMYDEKGLEEPPILGGRIYHIGYTLDYSSKRKTEICDPVYFSYRTYVEMGKPIKIRIERTDKVYPVISHH